MSQFVNIIRNNIHQECRQHDDLPQQLVVRGYTSTDCQNICKLAKERCHRSLQVEWHPTKAWGERWHSLRHPQAHKEVNGLTNKPRGMQGTSRLHRRNRLAHHPLAVSSIPQFKHWQDLAFQSWDNNVSNITVINTIYFEIRDRWIVFQWVFDLLVRQWNLDRRSLPIVSCWKDWMCPLGTSLFAFSPGHG